MPPHLAQALTPPSPTGSGAPGLTLFAALGRAPPQAVLQQLVGAGGAGTGHQAHGGLMEEDLKGRQDGRCEVAWPRDDTVAELSSSATTFQEHSTDTLTKAETHFHTPSSFHLSLGNLQVRATMSKGKKTDT